MKKRKRQQEHAQNEENNVRTREKKVAIHEPIREPSVETKIANILMEDLRSPGLWEDRVVLFNLSPTLSLTQDVIAVAAVTE